MANENRFNPALITLTLACLTAALAYLETRTPVATLRPAHPRIPASAQIGDQTVPARLWEDPIAAVLAATNKGRPIAELREQVRQREGVGANVSVLGVFVEGTPYAEDKEVRLRLRYAVQMALAEEGYVPADRSNLGAAQVAWPAGRDLEKRREAFPPLVDAPTNGSWQFPKAELVLPYEWFQGRAETEGEARRENVLLLWLPEESFADYPMRRLLLLAEALSSTNADVAPVAFRLVGPRSSNTLLSMVEDTAGLWPGTTSRQGTLTIGRRKAADLTARFRIASPQATAPDELLFGNDYGRDGVPRSWTKHQLERKAGLASFKNFTANDDQVAAELVGELRERGVDPASGSIAVIAEADTAYGRFLPLSFAAALGSAAGSTNAMDDLMGRLLAEGAPVRRGSSWPANLHSFSYLRGLDGTEATRGDKPAAGSKTGLREDQFKHAEGDAQIDYARRLANRMKEQARNAPPGQPAFVAIGVLGSDIYDKLILMQALRSVFPEALFFTTDLDARYLDPEVYSFTRNLIVAAPFGLAPEGMKRTARSVAPFRDGYQTGVFMATQDLLGDGKRAVPKPKVFEIGRTQAVELSGEVLAPDRWLSLKLVVAVLLLGPIALLALGAWDGLARTLARAPAQDSVVTQIRDRLAREHVAVQTVIWAVGFLAFSLFVAWLNTKSPGEMKEPYFLAEGVSVWPTQVVRGFAVLLAISMLALAWYRHRIRKFALCETYFCAGGDPEMLPLTNEAAPKADPSGREVRERRSAKLVLAWCGVILILAAFETTEFLPPLGDPWLRLSTLLALATMIFPGLRHARRIGRLRPIQRLKRSKTWETVRDTDTYRKVRGMTEFRRRWRASRWGRAWHRSRIYAWARDLEGCRKHISLMLWMRDMTRTSKRRGAEGEVDAAALFAGYVRRGWLRNRLTRAVPLAAYYLTVGFSLTAAVGFPHSPYRGAATGVLDSLMLFLSILAFCVVAFYVVDAVRLNACMIWRLGQGRTKWPQPVLERAAREEGLDPAHAAEVLDVQFTARQTNDISVLVYFPFTLLCLMLVARSQFFDYWTWTWPLICFFLLNGALVLACAVSVRRAAYDVRRDSIDRLTAWEVEHADQPHTWKIGPEEITAKNYTANLSRARKQIEAVHTGAYSPLPRDPALIAALIPTGGIGLLAVLQRLFL